MLSIKTNRITKRDDNMKQPYCPINELYLGIKDCLDCKKYFFESYTLCSRKEKNHK